MPIDGPKPIVGPIGTLLLATIVGVMVYRHIRRSSALRALWLNARGRTLIGEFDLASLVLQ